MTRLGILALLTVFAAGPSAVAALRDEIGFDQRIGELLPLDATLRDTAGAPVTLGEALGDKPGVLVFGYFTCPQLCGITSDGIIESLRALRPSIGDDYSLLYVSIDPHDTAERAATEQHTSARRYGRGDAETGWHYLTGDAAGIEAVTRAAGFRYRESAAAGGFAHPSGFVVVRPDGVISRYFLGLDFRPAEIADALRDAAARRNGTPVFNLLLACLHGGPGTRTTWPWIALQAGVGGTLLVLAGGLAHLIRRERRSRRTGGAG